MSITLSKWLSPNTQKESEQKDSEWENYQKEMKRQFIYLRDKGLNLQIKTLY